MKRGKHEWIIDVVVYTLLIVFCFLCIYPFWFVLVSSFNEGHDMMLGGVYWWPRKPTLENYIMFFRQTSWFDAIKVSILRTVVGASVTSLFTCLVGYALSRRKLMFGNVFRFLFVFSMYVSGGLIPFYVVLRLVGLLNSFMVYILPTALSLYFVMVGINFFRSIPESLYEAAELDGSSEINTFIRVVLPLSSAFIATLALFSAVGQWNSWLDSVYYVNDKTLRPMAYWMISIINRTQTNNSAQDLSDTVTLTTMATQSTAVIVAIAPILCVYPFLQKYFVKGMMIGSVKE